MRRLAAVALVLAAGGGLVPSAVEGQTPSFEVASVKRSRPEGPMMIQAGFRQGDRWQATNATLRMLVHRANIVDFPFEWQIVGGPGWVDTDRFDVVATSAPGASNDDVRAMTRALLAERFTVRTRRESREVPAFSLLAGRDGKPGPGLKPLPVDCPSVLAGKVKPEPIPGIDRLCVTNTMLGAVTRIESGGTSIENLVATISRATGRPVLNRTGLTGYFAFTLRFATEPGSVSPLGGPRQGTPIEPVDAPSLAAALQEQLGLRLESRRETLDVLVIESAAPPTEN